MMMIGGDTGRVEGSDDWQHGMQCMVFGAYLSVTLPGTIMLSRINAVSGGEYGFIK